MKKFFIFILFFFFIDVAFASDVYISKKDIDTGDYVKDCDFLLIDKDGNIIDSWIQDDSYHLSNLENGSYELVSRPYVMGVFNDEMSDYYKFDVTDDVMQFTVYNSKIETPKNLGINNFYVVGAFLIFIGLIVIFYCKYSFYQAYDSIGDTMNGKDEFKQFVRDNPNLIKYVKDGSKTWQDFYEIFSLYGSNDDVWKDYLNDSVSRVASHSLDFVSWLKALDLDSIQDGVASLQRVLGVVQDFTNKDDASAKDEYKPRPLYKHFED